jgi:hypothetical protein
MDRLNRYLDASSLPLLIAVPIIAIFVLLLTPRRWHMDVALFGMVVWMVLGRLTGLGIIQTLTKATGFAAILAVAFAAWFDVGPKRRLPVVVWAYPALAALSFIYVMTVVDITMALVLRTQWLLMTLAAVFVARTIVDEASLYRVLRAIGLGACVAALAPLSDLLLHPGEAINKGLGRFEPYGANSNQIGVLFSLAAPLALYLAYQTRNSLMKPYYLGSSVMALGMGLLTGSRSTLVTIVIPSIPTMISLGRKPMAAAAAAVLGLVILVFVVAQAGSHTAFERFDSLQTNRVQVAEEYAAQALSERPLFGLLGSSGMSYFRDEDIGKHAHNAYLDAMYLGGLSYGIPLLVMVGLSQAAAAFLFMRRRSLGVEPLTIGFLVAFMFTIYAQGFVNEVMYYPTYEWAFMHILLSTLLLSMAADAHRGEPPLGINDVPQQQEWADYADYGAGEHAPREDEAAVV